MDLTPDIDGIIRSAAAQYGVDPDTMRASADCCENDKAIIGAH